MLILYHMIDFPFTHLLFLHCVSYTSNAPIASVRK